MSAFFPFIPSILVSKIKSLHRPSQIKPTKQAGFINNGDLVKSKMKSNRKLSALLTCYFYFFPQFNSFQELYQRWYCLIMSFGVCHWAYLITKNQSPGENYISQCMNHFGVTFWQHTEILPTHGRAGTICHIPSLFQARQRVQRCRQWVNPCFCSCLWH